MSVPAAVERRVVLDLSGVSVMTTAGAVAVLEAKVRAELHSVSLLLVTSPAVDRLLTGLIEVTDRFTYVPSVAAGLQVPEQAATIPAPRTGPD